MSSWDGSDICRNAGGSLIQRKTDPTIGDDVMPSDLFAGHLDMGGANLNFESFVNFMKFMKLSRGTF